MPVGQTAGVVVNQAREQVVLLFLGRNEVLDTQASWVLQRFSRAVLHMVPRDSLLDPKACHPIKIGVFILVVLSFMPVLSPKIQIIPCHLTLGRKTAQHQLYVFRSKFW